MSKRINRVINLPAEITFVDVLIKKIMKFRPNWFPILLKNNSNTAQQFDYIPF